MLEKCIEDCRSENGNAAIALCAKNLHSPAHQLADAVRCAVGEDADKLLIAEIEAFVHNVLEKFVLGVVLVGIGDAHFCKASSVAGDICAEIGAGKQR